MVKWSAPARNDLKQIHAYIAKDSRYYARRVIQEIISKSEKLIEHPEIGRIAVIHGRRDFNPAWDEREP